LRRTIALPGRAQSRAKTPAQLSIVVEEADEALYWLELLRESGMLKPERLADLIREADELVAITLAHAEQQKARWFDSDSSNLGRSIGNRKSTI